MRVMLANIGWLKYYDSFIEAHYNQRTQNRV